MFTPDQIAALTGPLDSAHVKAREQAGRQLSYIEAYHAENEANRIFGFDAWDRTTELHLIGEREVDGKHRVYYRAKVRILVRAPDGTTVVREGCGYGSGIDRDLGQAHESALKEAESDAEKRALKTFGNPFGQALYDKSQSNVVNMNERKSAAQAKRDGDHERIKAELAACGDLEQLGAWGARLPEHLARLPLSWADPIRDEYEKRRNEIIEAEVEADGRAVA